MAVGTGDDEALLSLAEVAALAGVSRPAVSNWRRRFEDFPSPVQETGAAALFKLADLRRWAARHGKRFDAQSIAQLVWSALNLVRGAARPEEAAHLGMNLLGLMTLAERDGDHALAEVRHALGHSHEPSMLADHMRRVARFSEDCYLDERDLFSDIQPSRWPDCAQFLMELDRLAVRFGRGPVFEGLIAASARSGRGSGEYATPPSVAELVVSLASPLGGTVFDIACGVGTMLLAASRKSDGRELVLVGQDINSTICRVARLRALVHGLDVQIKCGDTLADETRSDLQADVILADPPFGGGRRYDGNEYHSRWDDLSWIQYGINKLRPDGVAIYVLPTGSLFRGGSEGEFRRHLIETGHIQAVITLPARLYPASGISVALWVVGRPGARSRGDILLADIAEAGGRRDRKELQADDIDAVTRCLHAWRAGEVPPSEPTEGVSAATVPIDAILADEGKLVPARWLENPPGDPAAMLHRIESAERSLLAATATLDQATWTAPRLAAGTSGSERKWTVAKMIDLGLLVRIRPRPVDPDVIGNGGTPFIRAADVGDDFSVTPSEQIDIDLIPPPVELTKPGDVLVTIRGGTSRTAVDQVGGAVASSSIQILRSERDIEPTVLAALVRSAARHYPTVGLTPHVKLAELEIPMLDLAASQQLSQTIQDLGGRRRAAQAAVQAIDELLECLSDGLGSGTLRLEMTLPAGTE